MGKISVGICTIKRKSRQKRGEEMAETRRVFADWRIEFNAIMMEGD